MSRLSSIQALPSSLRVRPIAAVLSSAFALTLALPFPVAGVDGGAALDKASVPVRIEIPSVGIDLPVLSSRRNMRGNPRGYPLCDVAQYWTRFDLPGAPGTTWIYAHAQPGMFLPLFTASAGTDGAGLLGRLVRLQLKDGRVLRYRIDEVKQRVSATNERIAVRDRADEHKLILQTSEGPPGTTTRLQAAASLVSARQTQRSAPKAQPRPCSQPAAVTGGNGGDTGSGRNGPDGPETLPELQSDEGDASEPITVIMASGAVLLGATLIAIYLVRRHP